MAALDEYTFEENMRNVASSDFSGNLEEIEYEVFTYSHTVGDVLYGPYRISIWDLGLFNYGERRGLSFCIPVALEEDDENELTAVGGRIAQELIIFSSLLYRTRLELGPITRYKGDPRRFSIGSVPATEISTEEKANLNDIVEWMNLVRGLKSDHKVLFIIAANLYHQALNTIELQPDISYLNLISAIESISRETEIEPVDLYEVDRALADLIREIKPAELQTAISAKIMKREKFIKRRFVQFIVDRLTNDFWDDDSRPEHGLVDREELPRMLGLIYDQRSRTLHGGESFPPWVFHPRLLAGGEMPIGLEIRSGEHVWLPRDYFPGIAFFEKAVNFVLKRFLVENQVEES